VRSQIDRGNCRLEQREDGVGYRLCVTREGEHRSVVRRVGRAVERTHASDVFDRCGEPVDHASAAAFADVRHALDQGHTRL